jgi:hypothetical protein
MSSRQRSAQSLHGTAVRMRYLCSCDAVSHLKQRDATAIRCVMFVRTAGQLRSHGELPQTGGGGAVVIGVEVNADELTVVTDTATVGRS